MPEKETMKRAKRAKREGKAPSTQAGEFVREEIHHVREGKHGARSAKQAIAIGLSKARRAGVKVPKPPRGGKAASKTSSSASTLHGEPSPTRSRAVRAALKREGHKSASTTELSAQAHAAAERRTAADRSASARRAARTKGPAKRSEAARKAARTRATHKAHGGGN